MDPNIRFNSPAMDSTTSKSSARLLRRKKPTPSTRSRPNWSTNDHDFNPFCKAPETSTGPVPGPGPGPGPGQFGLNSDTFGTGVSGKSGGAVKGFNLEDFLDKNVVSDELGKLSIGNNRAKQSKKVSETDKLMFFETRDGMKQLNIDEAVDFRTVLKRELEKLNIGDNANKVFTDTVITDHLKGLKIEETITSNCSAEENERADVNSKQIREEDTKGSKVEKGSGKNEGNLNSFSSVITTQEGLEGDFREDQATSTSSASFMWNGDPFPGIRNVFGVPLRDKDEEKARDYMGMEDLGFGALNLGGGFNEKPETAKGSRYRKRKGKVRKHVPTQSCTAQDSVFIEKPQENNEFVEQYSPMDVSPYRDTLIDEGLSQQTSVVSDQKLMHDEKDFSMESQVKACSDVREEDYGMRHTKEAELSYTYGNDVDAHGSSDESVSDLESESFQSAADHFDYSSDSFATAASDTEASYNSIARGHDDETGASQREPLPRGHKGKEALWLDPEFTQGPLDMTKASHIREAIANVIPLNRLAWDSPPGIQMEIGRGITARVVVQEDAPATDDVDEHDELADLAGQFGLSSSMLGTRIHKAVEAADKRKAELKKVTAALAVSDKAKTALEAKNAKILQENGRLKEAMKASQELDAQLQQKVATLNEATQKSVEELKSAQEKIAQLEEQLAVGKKAAEEAGPAAIAEYKLSVDFLDIQEASFDQGFNHFARCIWSHHGKESVSLEEMAKWVALSQRRPELLALHPYIPYSDDHIVDITTAQMKDGEQVWDPPPVNAVNLAFLKGSTVTSDFQAGDEYLNLTGDHTSTPPGRN